MLMDRVTLFSSELYFCKTLKKGKIIMSIINIIKIALKDVNDTQCQMLTMKTFAVQCKLDHKQEIAFESICSSFMLSLLIESEEDENKIFQSQLLQRGAREQLLMFLTGSAGSGKSYVICCCRSFCKNFCKAIGKTYSKNVFAVTGVSGVAASMARGNTSHLSAMLANHVTYNEIYSDILWMDTKLLVIEGISMAEKSLLIKLDKTLRKWTNRTNFLYGGIHIVFVGDFYQIPPVVGKPVYDDFGDIYWHGSLNACIMLDQCMYRYTADPEWGDILSRIRVGSVTTDDVEKINTRLLGNVTLTEKVDCMDTRVTYACTTNKRRNEVINECFQRYVRENSPTYSSDSEALPSAILIKGDVSRNGVLLGTEFHQMLWSICCDHNVIGSTQVKVDPCLKLFFGCPLLITCNTLQKRKLITKGTSVNYAGIKWKAGFSPETENYCGFKVLSGSVHNIESLYVQLESKAIRELKPEIFLVEIRADESSEVLRGFEVTQFAVNVNLAATVHSMEGMTKDIVIVADESKKSPWWLYVILSRVTSLNGLFLLKPVTRKMLLPRSGNLVREAMWLREVELDFIRHIETHD